MQLDKEIQMIRTLMALIGITASLMACGGAGQHSNNKFLVVLAMSKPMPSWVENAQSYDNNGTPFLGVVVQMQATGDLVDNPDVLLNMLSMDARHEVLTRVATSCSDILSQTMQEIDNDEGKRHHYETVHQMIQRSQMTVYGFGSKGIWENGRGRVYQLYVMSAESLRKSILTAGFHPEKDREIIDLLVRELTKSGA